MVDTPVICAISAAEASRHGPSADTAEVAPAFAGAGLAVFPCVAHPATLSPVDAVNAMVSHVGLGVQRQHPQQPNPPKDTLAGGANSSIQDPYAQGLISGCVGQFCYVDDIQSWSTNEEALNWNSALAWVAAFAADQGRAAVHGHLAVDHGVAAGRLPGAGPQGGRLAAGRGGGVPMSLP